jgi:hypothetical protein
METARPFDVKAGEEIAHIDFHVPLAITGYGGGFLVEGLILPPPAPGPGMGSVSGHVYRADTGAPVAGAILHLNRQHLNLDQVVGNAPAPSPLAERSGTDGAYTFALVEPGDYSVHVERQGFAPIGGQGPPDTQPSPIFLETGQHLGNLDYKLQPTGAISGSVRDQDGGPLKGLVVTAFCSRAGSLTTGRVDAGRVFSLAMMLQIFIM